MPPLAQIAAYLGIGAVVGFLAGLLGIGGAVIIVSSLALMFTARGYPASFVMHLAIGTSLAAMAAGALASRRAPRALRAHRLPQVLLPGLRPLQHRADGVQPAPEAFARASRARRAARDRGGDRRLLEPLRRRCCRRGHSLPHVVQREHASGH